MAVDIGAYGGNFDGSVFASSEFGKSLLTPPTRLLNSTIECPHYIAEDAAFSLTAKERLFSDYNLTKSKVGRYGNAWNTGYLKLRENEYGGQRLDYCFIGSFMECENI